MFHLSFKQKAQTLPMVKYLDESNLYQLIFVVEFSTLSILLVPSSKKGWK